MHLLVPIAANVVLGIVLAALFLARRTSDDVRLRDGDAALQLYRRRFPDADGSATVSADERGALIALANGSGVGLLQRCGRRWAARELATRDIRSVTVMGGDTLRIALADFGLPRAHIRIADAGARAAWLARLGAGAAVDAAHRPPGASDA